jgi:hypothetical protein
VHWRAFTSRLPVSFFSAETWVMLTALCRHSATADCIGARLALVRQTPLEDDGMLPELDTLTKLHDRESRAIASLSTRLRLAPSARTSKTSAAVLARTATPYRRPWEDDGVPPSTQ